MMHMLNVKVAFIADGSVLPRRSGIDAGPLPEAVPFAAPPSLVLTRAPLSLLIAAIDWRHPSRSRHRRRPKRADRVGSR